MIAAAHWAPGAEPARCRLLSWAQMNAVSREGRRGRFECYSAPVEPVIAAGCHADIA